MIDEKGAALQSTRNLLLEGVDTDEACAHEWRDRLP
jgi:hypothetical protein